MKSMDGTMQPTEMGMCGVRGGAQACINWLR